MSGGWDTSATSPSSYLGQVVRLLRESAYPWHSYDPIEQDRAKFRLNRFEDWKAGREIRIDVDPENALQMFFEKLVAQGRDCLLKNYSAPLSCATGSESR